MGEIATGIGLVTGVFSAVFGSYTQVKQQRLQDRMYDQQSIQQKLAEKQCPLGQLPGVIYQDGQAYVICIAR